MTLDLLIRRSAVISACGTFRLRLERDLARPGKVAAGLMVNPSEGDGDRDDHTIRKWYGFSDRLGIGRFILGNKFAYRAKDVFDLAAAEDAVGPDNDRHIEQILRDADIHIVGWGRLAKLPPKLRGRWRDVAAIADKVGCRLYCWGTAADGQPLHPLTLSYATQLVEWRRP